MAKKKAPVDMVVYMYLNTVTELVYVGSSLYGLDHRHGRHLKEALKNSSRFYRAMRQWPEEYWDRVVLEKCTTEIELDAAESKWIAECSSLDAAVGYNTYTSRYLRCAVAGGQAMKDKKRTLEDRAVLSRSGKMGANKRAENRELNGYVSAEKLRKQRWKNMSTDERREFLRECGRRGAAKSKALAAERGRSAGPR